MTEIRKTKAPRRKNYDGFSTFIYKILKRTNSDIHIKAETVAVLNDMGHVFISRLMEISVSMMQKRKRHVNKNSKPLLSSDICFLATNNLFAEVVTGEFRQYEPRDSFKRAICTEANKGVRLWDSHVKEGKEAGKEIVAEKFSAKSGLVIPLGRIKRLMRKRCPRNFSVSNQAKVFVAFALQYFFTEIIEMSVDKTSESSINTIIPRHLNLSIREDKPVAAYFANDSIVKGHVLPGIHASRLPSFSGVPSLNALQDN